MIEDADLILEFCTEAKEHLDNLDLALLSLEEKPEDKEAINAVFRPIHTIKGMAGFFNFVAIGKLTHVAESILVSARDKGIVLRPVVIDMLFETVDVLRKLIDIIQSEVSGGVLSSQDEVPPEVARLVSRLELASGNEGFGEEGEKKLGEILVEQGAIGEEDVEEALRKQAEEDAGKIGEVLIRSGKAKPQDVAKAIREQKNLKAGESRKPKAEEGIRVSVEKLDSLVDLVGELVIAQIQVASSEVHDQKLSKNIAQLSKITRELQNLTMSMHMLPIRPLFQRMERLVRDVSRKAGKLVRVTLRGEETELDRQVIDTLADPLVHMLRNAVDHGIESPEEREACGKDKTGNIYLEARHEAGNIVIEVRDDGRGLSEKKIFDKARQRGLVVEGKEYSRDEILNFIFQPGFSTAEKITDISGRGVGMDVVKKKIGSLRGVISMDTKEGEGTRFNIRLPLTMAIIDGMLVQSAGERYIFPTYCIEESLKPQKEQIVICHNRGKVLHLRDSIIPLIDLDRLLGMSTSARRRKGPFEDSIDECSEDSIGSERAEGLVMIIRDGSNRIGFFVDNLIGQQQVVIKSLGEAFQGLQGVSGGAILADGRVGLILDAHGLLEYYSTHYQGG
ncbi:MAG: chemotaxis protein CheA [bacterium]|nr:chemotaxis protein CheA [bacterium]